MNILSDPDTFKLIVENTPMHIVVTDKRGVILYVNSATEEITGYSRDELIGKNPSVWGGGMDKEFYKDMWRIISVEKKTFEGVVNNKKKNGTKYRSSIKIKPILDYKNEPIGFVGIENEII